MKYELQKIMFIGGSLRQKGDVIEYDGVLSSHQAIPLEPLKKKQQKPNEQVDDLTD